MLSRNATHGTGSASSGGIAPKGEALGCTGQGVLPGGCQGRDNGPGRRCGGSRRASPLALSPRAEPEACLSSPCLSGWSGWSDCPSWKLPVPWDVSPWREGACPLTLLLEGGCLSPWRSLSLGRCSPWKVPVPLEGGACPLGALGACPVPLERALGHCSRARWNGRRLVGQIASSSDSPRANARTTPQRSSANARSATFKRPLGAWARRQAPAASLFASIAVG